MVTKYSPSEEINKRIAWEKANAARFHKFFLKLTTYGSYYKNPAETSPGAIPFTEDLDQAAEFTTYAGAEERAIQLRTTYAIGTIHLIVVHDPRLDPPEER